MVIAITFVCLAVFTKLKKLKKYEKEFTTEIQKPAEQRKLFR